MTCLLDKFQNARFPNWMRSVKAEEAVKITRPAANDNSAKTPLCREERFIGWLTYEERRSLRRLAFQRGLWGGTALLQKELQQFFEKPIKLKLPIGFQKAGMNIVDHYFSEINKSAINIYKKHFPKAKELGDVTTIRDFSDLRKACAGKVLIITFGFPCQDLSVAGRGEGLAGTRSGLFFEAIRIVKELNPQYFIFENVKGLLTNNRGADFIRCLREIADLGIYDCQWQLVNTSWFLPQNRERIYFIGCIRGRPAPKVFPVTESNFEASRIQGQYAKCLTTKGTHTNGTYVAERKQLQKIGKDGKLKTNQHLASCLTGGGHSGGNHSDMDLLVQKTKSNPQGAHINSINGNSVCLSALGGGGGAKTGLYVVPRGNNMGGYREVENCPTITKSSFETNNFIVREATAKGFVEIPPNSGVYLTHPNSKTRHGRLMNKNCNSLTTQNNGLAWFDGVNIRRLTPLEEERLQGFPDGWTERGADGKKISNTARYRTLGNAVSTIFPEIIGKKIIEITKLNSPTYYNEEVS